MITERDIYVESLALPICEANAQKRPPPSEVCRYKLGRTRMRVQKINPLQRESECSTISMPGWKRRELLKAGTYRECSIGRTLSVKVLVELLPVNLLSQKIHCKMDRTDRWKWWG